MREWRGRGEGVPNFGTGPYLHYTHRARTVNCTYMRQLYIYICMYVSFGEVVVRA